MLCFLRWDAFGPLSSGHTLQLQIDLLDFHRMEDAQKETASEDRRRSREHLVLRETLEKEVRLCENDVELDRLRLGVGHLWELDKRFRRQLLEGEEWRVQYTVHCGAVSSDRWLRLQFRKECACVLTDLLVDCSNLCASLCSPYICVCPRAY